jgi:hypothetical protein
MQHMHMRAAIIMRVFAIKIPFKNLVRVLMLYLKPKFAGASRNFCALMRRKRRFLGSRRLIRVHQKSLKTRCFSIKKDADRRFLW